jgi:hypothetical protein
MEDPRMAWRYRFYSFPTAAAYDAAQAAAPLPGGAELLLSPGPDGEPVNVAVAFPGEPLGAAEWTAAQLDAPAEGQTVFAGWDTPVPGPRVLPPLAFMDLFTPAELEAVAGAALQSPAVLLWLTKASAAQVIELDSPQTSQGVQALVGAGILSAERAERILASLPPA